MGRVDNAALPALYAGCKAFLFPGEEDFGITPLEAMAAGRPVIAYGRGGVLDSVADGETGIFFERQTADALTESLKTQLEDEKNRSQEIKDYEEYTKTQKFIEDMAKSRLGLVYDNEVIFKKK